MDLSQKLLSEITIYLKYSKYIDELKRRETWDEIVYRNKEMHIKKFPQLKDEINTTYSFVYQKKVLPSMRSMQFAGKPIEISPHRIYNCSYMPIDNYRAFSEAMHLLLSGCGLGISVQKHHVEKLSPIRKPIKKRRFLISDSIEGWADAVKALFKAYFDRASLPEFDFSDIRQKGTRLKTSGGKAPGAEPLKNCLHHIKNILDRKTDGEQLRPIDVHDIICHIADAVLSGGIRRAAVSSLFSFDDEEMLESKFNHWWELNPQRGRANNSAVVVRHRVKKSDFQKLWKKIELSKSGEPGIFFTNDIEWGTNPCLTGDTLIETEYGEIKLEELIKKINNNEKLPLIYCFNEEANKIELQEITFGALTRKDTNIIKIILDDKTEIKLTPDHQVYTKNRGWIKAAQLNQEDILLQIKINKFFGDKKLEAKKIVERRIKKIEIVKNEDVYDISMQKNHNFFANKILVHNCFEISLRNNSFCNLTEISGYDISSQNDLNERVITATTLGTLQAAYTDFHY